MARRILVWVIGIDVLLVFIAILVGRALMYSGVFYVGADQPAPRPVDWFLGTASDRSSERHARGLKVPSLDNPARASAGFQVYDQYCVMCHGSPGAKPGPIGKGLQPEPPYLPESTDDMSPAQVFWVTKHGIRMTGMPAWGETLKDDQIWDAVAFIKQMAHLSPEQYQAMARQRAGGGKAPAP